MIIYIFSARVKGSSHGLLSCVAGITYQEHLYFHDILNLRDSSQPPKVREGRNVPRVSMK